MLRPSSQDMPNRRVQDDPSEELPTPKVGGLAPRRPVSTVGLSPNTRWAGKHVQRNCHCRSATTPHAFMAFIAGAAATLFAFMAFIAGAAAATLLAFMAFIAGAAAATLFAFIAFIAGAAAATLFAFMAFIAGAAAATLFAFMA